MKVGHLSQQRADICSMKIASEIAYRTSVLGNFLGYCLQTKRLNILNLYFSKCPQCNQLVDPSKLFRLFVNEPAGNSINAKEVSVNNSNDIFKLRLAIPDRTIEE